MKINKKILIIPLLSFLCLPKVYAECSQAEIDEFKQIENEFVITYEFNDNDKNYIVYISNPNQKSYMINLGNMQIDPTKITNIDEKTIKIMNVSSGHYQVEIIKNFIENENACPDTLKTIELELPKYNKYSEDELCADIPEFYLCQTTYDGDVDYDTFVTRVNIYKETQKNTEEKAKKQTQNEKIINKTIDKKISMIRENISLISICIIVTILLVIGLILFIKSLKKRRRLE